MIIFNWTFGASSDKSELLLLRKVGRIIKAIPRFQSTQFASKLWCQFEKGLFHKRTIYKKNYFRLLSRALEMTINDGKFFYVPTCQLTFNKVIYFKIN